MIWPHQLLWLCVIFWWFYCTFGPWGHSRQNIYTQQQSVMEDAWQSWTLQPDTGTHLMSDIHLIIKTRCYSNGSGSPHHCCEGPKDQLNAFARWRQYVPPWFLGLTSWFPVKCQHRLFQIYDNKTSEPFLCHSRPQTITLIAKQDIIMPMWHSFSYIIPDKVIRFYYDSVYDLLTEVVVWYL